MTHNTNNTIKSCSASSALTGTFIHTQHSSILGTRQEVAQAITFLFQPLQRFVWDRCGVMVPAWFVRAPNEGTRFLAINFRCELRTFFLQISQRQLLAQAWRYKSHIFGMDNEISFQCSESRVLYTVQTHFLK
jgi:hypothetical protein